eukprot:TRINITY_DN5116_c0_g1_i1.p1 TRINITY_DN5116_c0_g1~~TRINITY_DN5116_c0_g1_i1.p1  ORF type:complete len:416 (+),score=41.31 TRINITY_DN5116_c0_g1_i1:263-1510(+)
MSTAPSVRPQTTVLPKSSQAVVIANQQNLLPQAKAIQADIQHQQTELAKVLNKPPFFNKRVLLLIMIGLVQILIGILLLTCGGAVFGTDLIKDGINDTFSFVLAFLQGDNFSWAEYSLQKYISYCVTIICGGWSSFLQGFQAFQKVLKNFSILTQDLGKEGLHAARQNIQLISLKYFGNAIGSSQLQHLGNNIFNYISNNFLQGVKKSFTGALNQSAKDDLVRKVMVLDSLYGNDYSKQIVEKEASHNEQVRSTFWQRFVWGVFVGVACNKSQYLQKYFSITSKLITLINICNFADSLVIRVNRGIDAKFGEEIKKHKDSLQDNSDSTKSQQEDDNKKSTQDQGKQKYVLVSNQVDSLINNKFNDNINDTVINPVISNKVGNVVDYSTRSYSKIVDQNTKEFCLKLQQGNFQNKK